MTHIVVSEYSESIIEQIKNVSESAKISFDLEIKSEDLTKTLNAIFEHEASFNLLDPDTKIPDFFIDIKPLSNELKIDAFKLALGYENLINSSMILNITNMCTGVLDVDPDYFGREEIYFKDIVQLVVVKSKILNEVNEFVHKVATWILATLKSVPTVEYSPLDDVRPIPPVIRRILTSYDMMTLMRFVNNSKNINTDDLWVVPEAIVYIASMCSKCTVAGGLISKFLESYDFWNDDGEAQLISKS